MEFLERCACGSCLSLDGLKNLFCMGKENCKCCYCCLDEAARVGRVMDQFAPIKLETAPEHANEFQMYVGRVTLPPMGPILQVQCMYSPGSNAACVYWRVVAQEEWVQWREVDDYETRGSGENQRRVKVGSHWVMSRVWRKVVDKENFVDFYLQDGAIKLFVEGSKRDHCKVQSEWDAGGGGWNAFGHSNLPPGVKWLIDTHASGFGGWGRTWYNNCGHIDMPTGRFRWSECTFEVNEKIACLGITSDTYPDPYTQTGNTALIPFTSDLVNREQMTAGGWSYWDQFSWADLLEHSPQVLLSDKTLYTDPEKIGFDVSKALDLPKWMTVYTPQYAPWGGGIQYVPEVVQVAAGTANVPAAKVQQPMMVQPQMVQPQMVPQQQFQQPAMQPQYQQPAMQPQYQQPQPGMQPQQQYPPQQPGMQPQGQYPPGQQQGQPMLVTVPAGVQPGMQFQVQNPQGQLVNVMCPGGVQPGMQIQVNV